MIRDRVVPIGAVLALCILPAAAPGIVISGGTGNPAPTNDTAPSDNPGWNRVGSFETAGGNGSGVYLGNGWVLTANHVNGKNTFTLNGDAYTLVGGTGQRLANPAELGLTHASDLWLGQYVPAGGSAPLPAGNVTLATSTPATNSLGTMIGTGQTQTAATPSTFHADTDLPTWAWDDAPFAGSDATFDGFYRNGPRDKRWAQSPVVTGQTEVFLDFTIDSLDADQVGFYTLFEDVLNGGMASGNDSGSGYFIKNGSTWELAGIAHAIAGFNGQLDDPDTAETALFGNATLYSDLSVYAAQINAITAIPEPATAMLAIGGVATLVLGRKRR